MKMISYGRQFIDRYDIEEVVKVLRSDWISQGPRIREFEEAIADYCGTKYAVAVSSGTAALHIACLASGLNKGDEAITTPITFLATANSILYAGAKPKFADIDLKTFNINPDEIIKNVTKKTAAILPVHFAGLPCDMQKICRIAKKHSLIVIEDACHALGAEYECNGKRLKVGSCRHSDMTVFSFHPVKSITTGEGGAITTNNNNFYKKLLALRSHGIYKDKAIIQQHGLWYYEMRSLGFNYRITDFQCALGISQFKKIDTFLKRRQRIGAAYNRAFESINFITTPAINSDVRHAHHIYVLRIEFEKFNMNREIFMETLKKACISTQVHYIPIYNQPYYKNHFNFDRKMFPASEKYYREAISIPIYPLMSDREVDYVIRVIKKTLKI